VTQTVEAQRTTLRHLDLAAAAKAPAEEVMRALGSSSGGLSTAEAGDRLARLGPNALRSHGVRAIAVFLSQLRSPFLALLLATALASVFIGERTDALIIS
jgi:Mg2+-importing ATPase